MAGRVGRQTHGDSNGKIRDSPGGWEGPKIGNNDRHEAGLHGNYRPKEKKEGKGRKAQHCGFAGLRRRAGKRHWSRSKMGKTGVSQAKTLRRRGKNTPDGLRLMKKSFCRIQKNWEGPQEAKTDSRRDTVPLGGGDSQKCRASLRIQKPGTVSVLFSQRSSKKKKRKGGVERKEAGKRG